MEMEMEENTPTAVAGLILFSDNSGSGLGSGSGSSGEFEYEPEYGYESAAESEPGIFAVPFDSHMKEKLEGAWPFVESALEKHKITCNLNLDESEMVFDTRANKDPDVTYMARCLLRLLLAEVPPWRALRVADGMPCDIISMGHIYCQHGIKQDVYLRWKKLLLSRLPVEVLEEVSGCEIYLCPEQDVVCSLGPRGWLNVIRKIVEECILHGISPAPFVKVVQGLFSKQGRNACAYTG